MDTKFYSVPPLIMNLEEVEKITFEEPMLEGEYLYALRKLCKWTQTELGEAIEETKDWVSRVERGHTTVKLSQHNHILLICNARLRGMGLHPVTMMDVEVMRRALTSIIPDPDDDPTTQAVKNIVAACNAFLELR